MDYSSDNPAHLEEDDLPLTAEVDAHPMRLAPDISERLSTGEQATFFCTIVDSAVDAIIAHRLDGTIIWANKGAADLLGYDSEEIMKLPPYGWVAPARMSGAPRRIEEILRTGQLTFGSEVRCKDGSLIETEVSTRRVDTALGPVVVSVIRDVSSWAESKRALEHLVYHDCLTGLANRAYFDERLAIAIADARRFGDVIGLAYLDLDEFKAINDRYGHDIGDDVLIEIGRRVKEELRVQDTVARVGGDEFALILPRLSSPQALEIIAARLAERVREPMQVLHYTLDVGTSIGLATFNCDTDDARSLLVKADIAMYAAKKDPEHRWLTYFDGMPVPDGRRDT